VADSPETARLRRLHGRAKVPVLVVGLLWVISGASGCLLDELGRDDLIESYALWPFVVTSPLLLGGLLVLRRRWRILNLHVRRDLAASRRSSEAVPTPIVPLLYPTPAPPSPETMRLEAHQRRFAPIAAPILAVWLTAWVMLANDALASLAFATLLATSVLLAVLAAKVGSNRALDASKRHDVEAHCEAVSVEAGRTRVPPVLYLRSFADDDSAARRHGALTEEEQLAKALAWIGPLFAVGKPGETLPQVGAQRIYVADNQWQARVSELMAEARLVVLRTGSTGGFRWEVERAMAALTPDRLLLVADDTHELGAVLDAIAGRVGRPAVAVRLPGRAIATVKGLVMFGADWSPQPLRLVRAGFYARESDEPLVVRFTLALRPLFDRLGVTYTKPGYSPIKIGIAACLFAATVVFVVSALSI
jgi:hypothetical protein